MEPDRHELDRQLEEHHSASFGWALSCCRWNRTEAEDVLQTSYLKVLDGKAIYDGRSSFKTWLFGVVRRTAAEQRRRRAIREMALGRWFAVLAGMERNTGNPDQRLALSDDHTQLVNALRSLPRRQREVLELVFYQELTIRAAAEVLQVSLGTARTHYERGKKRLREILGKETSK